MVVRQGLVNSSEDLSARIINEDLSLFDYTGEQIKSLGWWQTLRFLRLNQSQKSLMCVPFMISEEAYLLCGVLAALEVVIAVRENLRLNNRHQAILLN